MSGYGGCGLGGSTASKNGDEPQDDLEDEDETGGFVFKVGTNQNKSSKLITNQTALQSGPH